MSDKCCYPLLEGSLEYRCCKEILGTAGKMAFIGDGQKCLTQYEYFNSLAKRTVLEIVGPLFKTKDGRYLEGYFNFSVF